MPTPLELLNTAVHREAKRALQTRFPHLRITIEVLDFMLPTRAAFAGYHFVCVEPWLAYGGDPYFLLDKDYNALREWTKPPSLTELREVIATLEAGARPGYVATLGL